MTTLEKLHPQYLTDSTGKKTSVLLPYNEFMELLEDLEDLAIIAQRRDDSDITLDELKAELGL